jgi:hypothetical protein
MLLSSGGFAIYRGFLPIYKILIPRFGSMKSRAHRERILETWLHSKGFRRTGLDAGQLSASILNQCRTGGDFIRVVMGAVAQSQQAQRWAMYDPDNVLHVERVKREIPNALFVHIIRDGRDIALSLKKMGGFTPLPWDRDQTGSLVATALYWEWMVHQGRAHGRKFPADYIEIHFEDLIGNPHETLDKLGGFLDHDLDYDRIQRAGLGRLSETNSSFREEGAKEKINPLGRWKERMAHADVAAIEATVSARCRAPSKLAPLLDARNLSRLSRWQAVAEVAYARRPARRYVGARTRRRTGADGRVGPVLRIVGDRSFTTDSQP